MNRDDLNALRSGAWSALWAFLAALGLPAAGWLQKVAEWASTSGRTPLPGLSILGYAVVAAAVGAATGLVATVVRLAQAHGVLPGRPPTFPKS